MIAEKKPLCESQDFEIFFICIIRLLLLKWDVKAMFLFTDETMKFIGGKLRATMIEYTSLVHHRGGKSLKTGEVW